MDIQFTAPLTDAPLQESDPAFPSQPLDEALVGNRPLWQQRQQLVHHLDLTGSTTSQLTIVADAWLSAADATLLLTGQADHITDATSGETIAWTSESRTTLAPGNGSFRIRSAADLLAIHRQLMSADAVNYHAGSVSPDATVDGFLMIDKGSSIDSGATITGTVAIGKGSSIGSNVTLTGLVAIGNNATIGDQCELTDCIVYPDTHVATGSSHSQQILVP
ncbi:hypothetical protein [Sulfuriroseicoccus oceanibius]|uniref:Uncharacterized protein n=1 Tax=Sulfuriroseicoccus oceanibius TaxID=2707525 RepID=A0A6B3L9C1_9BACT|nr:hypothetical protein [Sulfuriroseicoccus oceanibius]QQL43814.1 hypothetical protein G3M56_007875 [Sulfuriroseicoccus oceanibius]